MQQRCGKIRCQEFTKEEGDARASRRTAFLRQQVDTRLFPNQPAKSAGLCNELTLLVTLAPHATRTSSRSIDGREPSFLPCQNRPRFASWKARYEARPTLSLRPFAGAWKSSLTASARPCQHHSHNIRLQAEPGLR